MDPIYRAPGAPAASSELARPGEGWLYSPGQVGGATFLGSPLAGCILLASNYRKLGNEQDRRKSLTLGAIGSLALVGVGSLLPEGFSGGVIAMASTVVMQSIAKHAQGAAFERHRAAGGARASNWRAAGIGLVCVAALLALIFLSVFVFVALTSES